MSKRPRPLVAAALLCDRVLTEKDGAQTYVRVIDTLIQRRPAGSKASAVFQVWLVVNFRSGEAMGKYTLKLRMNSPSGKTEYMGDEIPFVLNGGEQGANINIQLSLATVEEGLSLIDVLVDDETLTRVPFRVRLEETPLPERSTPSEPSAPPAAQ